jgi:hypothetical protein
LALVFAAGAASAIEIQTPKDGATVREKVRIVVPRANVPNGGYVGLYIDNEFVVAQAPASQGGPIVFVWDTKQPRGKAGLTAEKRNFDDGEHVLEVRSYTQEGNIAERDQVSVLLNNRVVSTAGQLVRLSYKFQPGQKTIYELRTEVEATATGVPGGAGGYPGAYPGGYPGGAPGYGGAAGAPGLPGSGPGFSGGDPFAGAPPGSGGYPGAGMPGAGLPTAGGPQRYVEYRKVSVYVADNQAPRALLREFPENPLTVIVNGTKQPVYLPAVSRYFWLTPRGDDTPTTAMERENREPFYNVIRLPATSVRVGQEFIAPLHIGLGAFIPERLEVRATNVVEAVEWELGSPSARIRSTYDVNGTLSLPTLGITEAKCKMKGTSVIHFAPGTGKPMRAVHTLDGDVIVDLSRQQAIAGAGVGMPGGAGLPGMVPGAPGFPGAPGGLPGGEAGGPPSYGGGYPGAPGGVPGSGGGLAPQTQTYKTKIRATMTAQR